MKKPYPLYRDRKSLIIMVDFDGTIVEQAYPGIGKPLKNVKRVLRRLKKRGHRILIFTARTGRKLRAVVNFLTENGYPFDAINTGVPNPPFESYPKPAFDINWDDRNAGGLMEALEFEQLIIKIENGGNNER